MRVKLAAKKVSRASVWERKRGDVKTKREKTRMKEKAATGGGDRHNAVSACKNIHI